jgi:hypothetical protein
VDGVALASVITPLVAISATSGVAIWSARQSSKLARESARHSTKLARESAAESAKLARETRVQQRLGESYLEVLRIVEREAQCVAASITNWKLAVEEEAEFGIDAVIDGHVTGFERVKVPEPAVTDRATIAALLAAFGSPNVRELYEAWRSTIAAIDTEEEVLRWDCQQNPPWGPGIGGLKKLLDELQPTEVAARQALADAIAEELGHR